MSDTIIRKKVRGSNRISTIRIKRVRGETLVYIKICEAIAELLKGTTSEDSETMLTPQGTSVKIYNRTKRWHEVVQFFNEQGRKDNFSVYDDKNKPLIDYSNGMASISVYPLRLTNISEGVEVKIPQMTTLAGLEAWADKLNK